MSRIAPLSEAEIPETLKPYLAFYETVFGFVPEPLLILARKPKLVEGICKLAEAVQGEDVSIPFELRMMVATVASYAHGCLYCQAHATSLASANGISDEKITELWNFEKSSLFTSAEKAALRFALHAASTPNTVSDDDFQELREYYSDEEIIEILAQVSFMGWWNRFNDSMASTLEAHPRKFGENKLGKVGWNPGKHAD